MSLVKSREEFKKAYLQTISKLYYRQFNGKLPSSFNLDNCYLNIDLSRYQSGDEEKDNGANNTKTSRKVPEKEEEDDTEYSSSSSSSSSPSTSSESFVSSDSEMKKKRKVKQSKEESSDSANSDSSNTSEEEEEEESSEEKSESKKSKVKSYIPLKNGIKRRKVHSVSPTNSVKKLPLSSRKEKSPTKPKEEEKEKNQKLKRSNESSPLIEEPNSNSPSKKQKTTEKTSPTSQPPKIIRTSSKSNTIEEDNEIGEVLEGHCHHCKKRRPRCAVCPKNKRHRFCSSCIAKHFGMDYEELIEESPAVIWKLSGCPKCQGKCPCAQCTKTKEKRKAISN